MSGRTNSFGYWGNGGVSPDVRETVWTTVTDGNTTIHVANPSTLGNPDIDARSADFVIGNVAVGKFADDVNSAATHSTDEATYLADSVHLRGRP